MRRKNIFSLVVGLFAAASTFAQAPKPAGLAARELALEAAMDKKDAKADRRSTKPVDSPDIDINCNLQTGNNRSINAVVAKLDPHRAWTLEVSGTCNENVTIQSFENLTLIAKPGASINDPSGGNLDVIDVDDTHEFVLQGFTISGGANGVGCFDYSLCRFSGNTIQGAAAGDGLLVVRSQASLQGDTLQNNAGRGLAATNGSNVLGIGVTSQSNAAAGVIANVGGHLTLVNLTSRNNGGFGIRVANHSTLRLFDSTLTGNGLSGARLDGSSEAVFNTSTTGSLITGNATSGVDVLDLSFVSFAGADQITGNNIFNPGGVDVFCGPQFSATRGALTSIGGGTTNCTEP